MASNTEELGSRYLGLLLDGRYRLNELVGRGGMGAVFRALDERLKRQVAVKVIQPGGAAGDELARHRQRFTREAQLVARITHPNVVTIHDFGTYVEPGTGNELDYIVMELLRGENLAQWLPRLSRTDFALPYSLLMQTALGVAAGHREGVVHRDVKPRNVLVVPAGEPGRLWARVVDFGIAKPLHDDGAFGEITIGPGFVGTASYASPEQLVGRTTPGPESDVFSLGLVGYELFTGTLPFTEADRTRLSQGLHAPLRLPPSAVNPAIPGALEEVLVRALALDPAERFANADAFAAALDAAWRRAEAAGQLAAAAAGPETEVQPAAVGETVPASETQLVTELPPPAELSPPSEAPSRPSTPPRLVEPPPSEVPPEPTPVERRRRLAGVGRRAAVWLPAAALGVAVVVTALRGEGSIGIAIASILPSGWRGVDEIAAGQSLPGEIDGHDRVSETGAPFDVYRYRSTEAGPVLVRAQTSFRASIEWGRMQGREWQVLERSALMADPWITVSPEDGGEYQVRVQSQYSDGGSYTLTVTPGAPALRPGSSFTSTLGAADARLPDGEYAEQWTYRGSPGEQVTVAVDSGTTSAQLEWGRIVGGDWMVYEATAASERRLTATAADSGEYVIRVLHRPSGDTPAPYTISMTSGAREIGPGQTRGGRLSRADTNLDGGAYEVWKYRGTPQQVTFSVQGRDSTRPSLEVGRLVNGQWEALETSGSADGGQPARLLVTMDTAAYVVRARKNLQTDPGGEYELSVSTSTPSIALGQTLTSILSRADTHNSAGWSYETWDYHGLAGQWIWVEVRGSGRYSITLYRLENGTWVKDVSSRAHVADGSWVYTQVWIPVNQEYRIHVFTDMPEQSSYSLRISRVSQGG
jgi:serine/threonine protein kinase